VPSSHSARPKKGEQRANGHDNMDHILLCFEAMSGLKINLRKLESITMGQVLNLSSQKLFGMG
jgi:hypothetical protein